jgi:hypothetical protein
MVKGVNQSMAQALANLTSDDVAAIMTKQDPQSDPAASKALWDDFPASVQWLSNTSW